MDQDPAASIAPLKILMLNSKKQKLFFPSWYASKKIKIYSAEKSKTKLTYSERDSKKSKEKKKIISCTFALKHNLDLL